MKESTHRAPLVFFPHLHAPPQPHGLKNAGGLEEKAKPPPEFRGFYLQCTVMGWLPDCCCCFCTAAMMLIIPFPSLGIPTSGQPWK